jgi:hypothetical protein
VPPLGKGAGLALVALALSASAASAQAAAPAQRADQFAAATRNGRRSATVSVNTQLSPDAGSPAVFRALRRIDALAVCAALARRR